MSSAAARCHSCAALDGSRRISPGPSIHVGRYWQVEHAYPSRLVGWLIIVLRRHAIALHELESAEFAELAVVLERTVRVLHETLEPAKEYVACYAEQQGFEHLHFHVVPRATDLPERLRGASSFSFLRVGASEAADADSVRAFCESLRTAFARN